MKGKEKKGIPGYKEEGGYGYQKGGYAQQFPTSVRPLRMKYQCISIKLCAMGVAGTAPKVQGVAA